MRPLVYRNSHVRAGGLNSRKLTLNYASDPSQTNAPDTGCRSPSPPPPSPCENSVSTPIARLGGSQVQVVQVEEVEVQVEEGQIIQAANIRAERVQVEDGEIRQAAEVRAERV